MKKQTQPHTIIHPLPAVYDRHSRILILGSFPSVKTREMGFFYGHPQNRFWNVAASVFQEEVPMTIEERHAFLLRNRIALWDSIHQCTIVGSSDSSIRNVVPNDLRPLLKEASIEQIFCNGRRSWETFHRYIEPTISRSAVLLPSTSPANAAWTMEKLIEAWSVIR